MAHYRPEAAAAAATAAAETAAAETPAADTEAQTAQAILGDSTPGVNSKQRLPRGECSEEAEERTRLCLPRGACSLASAS